MTDAIINLVPLAVVLWLVLEPVLIAAGAAMLCVVLFVLVRGAAQWLIEWRQRD